MSVYLDKIKQISKISVSKVCKELNINRANLLNGRSSEANEKKVYDRLIEKMKSTILTNKNIYNIMNKEKENENGKR